jgi:membrane protein YdbS with pleckstrin-like domain
MATTQLDMSDPEHIVARVRTHGRRLTLPVILLIALAAASGYFIGSFDEAWKNLLAAAGAVAVLIFGVFVPVLQWLTWRTTITTHRVISRWGVLTRHRTEVPFTRIRTVSTHRSIGQRLWGCGDIELDVAEGEPFTLQNVPSMQRVADVLHQLIQRSYRAQSRLQSRGTSFFEF